MSGRSVPPGPPPLIIRGGAIHDPAHDRDGEIGDVWIEGGRIVPPRANRDGFAIVDASGLVVMPGAVDLHSHVAGPKVCLGRRMTPSGAGRGGRAAVPTIGATGRAYAALGYTTVFDAAIATGAARMAHLELAELPILDKGIYLLAGDERAVIDAAARADASGVRRLVGGAVSAGRGWTVKVANPGGSLFWRHGRRGDHHDLDTPLPGSALTPRLLLERLGDAVDALALPHALHVHTANLGLPGNWRTLDETMRTFEGRRAHLAHVQFHSYTGGDLDEGTFGSGVETLAERFNATPGLTLDVGQVLFGDTVVMTGDTEAAAHLARTTGVPWVSHDEHLAGGCGVMPIRYREKSLIHAWQWAIGLEWYLRVADPWRAALSTDHPNGAHFLAYPLLMRLLGDEPFRREAFSRLHPAVRARSALASLPRQYTLQELCIITRAAPARIAGLAHKGHLGPGADADVVLYRPQRDLERMFALPARVYKAGVLVAEEGEIRAAPRGATLAAALPGG